MLLAKKTESLTLLNGHLLLEEIDSPVLWSELSDYLRELVYSNRSRRFKSINHLLESLYSDRAVVARFQRQIVGWLDLVPLMGDTRLAYIGNVLVARGWNRQDVLELLYERLLCLDFSQGTVIFDNTSSLENAGVPDQFGFVVTRYADLPPSVNRSLCSCPKIVSAGDCLYRNPQAVAPELYCCPRIRQAR